MVKTKKRKLSSKPEQNQTQPEQNPTQPETQPQPQLEPEPNQDPFEATATNDDDDVVEENDNDDDEQQLNEESTQGQNDTDEIPQTTHATESSDDTSPEALRCLLDPLSKSVVVDLLVGAASAHPDVLSSLLRVADADVAHRKIFVHGLGWDATAETLSAAFSPYGEIEDCNAVRDRVSGKSKGYGFVLFRHRSSACAALKEPQKKIGGRMTACQLASLGPVPSPSSAPSASNPAVSEYTQRKIFVSNVGAEIDPRRLLEFFRKFGEIEEGPLGLDKATGKPKGFALFVYKSIDSARKALEEPHKNFEGHILHCQKAVDGPKLNKPSQAQVAPSVARGSHYARSESSPGFGGGTGHLMAPSAPVNPALGQALTALLASQGAGLGLSNLMGGSHGMGNSVGYGGQQVMTGYGGQSGGQLGYGNPSLGQGSAGRSQQGMGYMGGVHSYMGH